MVRNDLVVTHDVGATQGTGKSAVYLRFNSRNRLLFASKWLPKRIQRRWIRQTPAESYRVLVRAGADRRKVRRRGQLWLDPFPALRPLLDPLNTGDAIRDRWGSR